ncbi:MAG TPA: hypothetical protein VGP72_10360 [Planctomycetota bacterium]|jgi:hypothetical protein
MEPWQQRRLDSIVAQLEYIGLPIDLAEPLYEGWTDYCREGVPDVNRFYQVAILYDRLRGDAWRW